MVDDYAFSDPGPMTLEEKHSYSVMRQVWRMIATDLDQQSGDPLLYPGKASDELLAKFPPTLILEGEFDMFITETTRFARRLSRAGRLLEYVVFPGVTHHVCLWPAFRMGEMFNGTYKKVLQEYLHL
jgi:acetyl esterase/lipase